MKSLFGMQRANGDWFAIDDKGGYRVPIFRNAVDAMVARSRDRGMECFRPVILDGSALHNLTTTAEEGSAGFWLVEDPARKLTRSLRLDQTQLLKLIRE